MPCAALVTLGRRLRCLALAVVVSTSGVSPALGQSFFAAGALGQAATTPHLGGWYAFGLEIDKSAQLYSYTETDEMFSRANHYAPVASPQTGFLTSAKKIGPIWTFAFATAGAAVTAPSALSSGSTTAAFSGGGMALIPLSLKKFPGASLLIAMKVFSSQATGTKPLWYFGFEVPLQ